MKTIMSLTRKLGIFHLTLASVTGMIGSGWLFGEMYAASIAGPYSIISWIIGSMMMMALALVFAELGGKVPVGGAAARFPLLSHGKAASSLNGWALFLGYVSTPPLEAIASVSYLNFLTGGLINSAGALTTTGIGVAVLFLLAFFALNTFGIGAISKTNSILAVAKLIIPALTAIVLMLTYFSFSNFTVGTTSYPGAEAIFIAIPNAGIVFSFLGFRQAIELSGEAKNPGRTIPIAVVLGIVLSTAIYILVQVAFIGSMQWNKIPFGDWAQLQTSSFASGPLVVLATALGIGWLALLLLGDGVFSPLGTASIYETTTSRVTYALSEIGLFPAIFKRLNRHSVPATAMAFDIILMILFLIPAPSWTQLVALSSDLAIIAYASGPVALMVLRRAGYDAGNNWFRLPFASTIAPIAFISAILLVYWSGYPTTLYMSIVAIAGLALFFIPIYRHTSSFSDIKGALWFIAILIAVPVVSYLGSEGSNVIGFPYDVAVMGAVSLAIYWIALRTGLSTESVEEQRNNFMAVSD